MNGVGVFLGPISDGRRDRRQFEAERKIAAGRIHSAQGK